MKKFFFIAITLSALIVLPLTACSEGTDNIDVPYVAGESLAEARADLEDAGFENIKIVDSTGEDIDIKVPEDKVSVYKTEPAQNKSVSPDETITVFLSQPADSIEVSVVFDATNTIGSDKSAQDVIDALKAIGYSVTVNAPEGSDLSKCTVASVDDTDYENNSVTITVAAQGSNDTDVDDGSLSAEDSADSAASDNDNNAMMAGDAWIAVRDYGEQQYPYGFKVHYFTGVISEYEEDGIWYLKGKCDVTNEYDATRSTVVEAQVQGTRDNPEVIYFYVYD